MPKPKKRRAGPQQRILRLPLPGILRARLPVFTLQKVMREISRASEIGHDGRWVVFQSFVRASRPKPPMAFWREKGAVEHLREKFGKTFFEGKGAMAVLFREWTGVMRKAAGKGYRSLTPGEAALADAVMAACRNYQSSKMQKQMKSSKLQKQMKKYQSSKMQKQMKK